MKKEISKTEAKETINSFFHKDSFKSEEMRKTKRLAMKYKISLSPYKKLFCKSCLSQLKGQIRISKTHKTITCKNCNYKNKIKLS